MTDNKRINSIQPLTSPEKLMENFPLNDQTKDFIEDHRVIISDIIHGDDDRLVVIVWPCSIHDPEAAIQYAQKLKILSDELGRDNLIIVMRVYFEKPRTTIGWKWLINDPDLDGSRNITKGLPMARKLLVDINELWLPAAWEALDPISPAYLWDTFSYSAIWARTTESQTHREMASWLSAPVWFKNGTDGGVQVAIDAIGAARGEHSFLWVGPDGVVWLIDTNWNEDAHVILRWGWWKSNYDEESIKVITDKLDEAWIDKWLVVDFSHANSSKKHKNQVDLVCPDVAKQIAQWNSRIVWVMIESNLVEWNQKISNNMVYGQSITDACVGFEDTEIMLRNLDRAVVKRRLKNIPQWPGYAE